MPNLIKIDFGFATRHGEFRDALYLPENHAFTEEQIDTMKQERLDNWIQAVESPAEPEPERVEINGIVYERATIDGQVVLIPVEI